MRSGIEGHVCKQGKLLMIEPRVEQMEQEVDSGKVVREDDEPIGGDDDEVTYIVHALVDYSHPQTMKVNGFLKCQQVTILIDTGSTNNFLDESIAQNFSIPTEDCEPFEVTLVDGGTFTCNSKCSNVKLAVQDLELQADLYLLPLGDYKVVLGMEWLRTLGNVLWNFSKLTVKFTLNGKRVIVQGK
jgi:predicted aspartyl protease